jgi:cytochrome c biogenesis protein CcmG/thiol:disulfide interchange protein DsbE
LNHTGQAMGFRITTTAVIGVLVAAVCAAAAIYAISSSEQSPDPGAANPESAAADYDAALAGAPKPLADLYAHGDALLDGGVQAFKAQLAELHGHPVVVNKWASWCGPCRFEFPFFQSQAAERGTEVAFIGVDSDDSPEAAATFLEELPLPYPSFSDPDQEIARLFDAREFPSTAFYDAGGELVYVRRGGYASEAELAADIARYAG